MNPARYFEDLHAVADPFGYRTSWYEQRKRDLLVASLAHPRYQRGWELGCSNGVLTRALAGRCSALLATDISHAAVQQARELVDDLPQVEVQQARHPDTLPAGSFDLIVCSEMGYYLTSNELHGLKRGLDAALAEDGLLVACHWQPGFDEARCTAEAVHGALGAGLVEAFRYQDADFVLQGWCRTPSSVAARENLR